MNANPFTYGFRVAGGPQEKRKLITWAKAFAAHCVGDVSTGEAYLSAWTYGLELVGYLAKHESTAGYTGPCFADLLPLDIDGKGVDPLPDAVERTAKLLAWLECQGADLSNLSCWFSGKKGFHVLLPVTGLAGAEPGHDFHKIVRAFVARIGQESGANPDLAIYDKLRLFRAPNTRHPATGLFKVSIRAEELLRISADGVRAFAASPRPCEAPEPEAWCDWNLGGHGGYWGKGLQEASAIAVEARQPATERTALNRATLDFIRCGAPNGEREVRLFQAAANLAEFGSDERLTRALLLETALDSGLSPNEAAHAITRGISHARRNVS